MNNIINKDDYEKLHTDKLIPLDMKIDPDLFHQDMSKYSKWHKWGDKFHELNRFGLPLVNLNGKMYNEPEPSCWPLDRWNFTHLGYDDTPEQFNYFYQRILDDDITDFLLDYDFRKPTPMLDEVSFDPLNVIKPYMVRSCILKWYENSLFYPHVDIWHPIRWLRIWGSSNVDNIKFRFRSENGSEVVWNDVMKTYEKYEIMDNLESGRLYLMDGLQWHDAICTKDVAYHFFIALDVSSANLIEQLKLL